MVAARAIWKGFIKFGEVPVAVALYTAASSSERIAFNTLNRATGNRVRREFVDSETGKPVERDEQVKGYEVENGDYVVLEPEEVASAVPGSDKTRVPSLTTLKVAPGPGGLLGSGHSRRALAPVPMRRHTAAGRPVVIAEKQRPEQRARPFT
jgi:Ku70/Ku80 beta-barrel domain